MSWHTSETTSSARLSRMDDQRHSQNRQRRSRVRRVRLLGLSSLAVLSLGVGALTGCSQVPTPASNCATMGKVVSAVQPIVDAQLDRETFEAYDASLKNVLDIARPAVDDPALTPLLDELDKVDPSKVDPAVAQQQYRTITSEIIQHCPKAG